MTGGGLSGDSGNVSAGSLRSRLADPPGPAPDGLAEDAQGSLRTLARGSVITLAGMISNGVLNIVLLLAVTRGLHALGAGLFFQIVALFTILTSIAEFGAAPGLVRTIARYRALGRPQDIRSVLAVALWPVVVVGAVLAAAVFALAPQLADILGVSRAEGVRYLRMFAPFLPLAAASSVALSATRGFGTMVPYVAVENLGKPALRPVLVMLAIASGFGTLAVALAWAFPIALAFPVALLAVLVLLRRTEHEAVSLVRTTPIRDLASEFWRFAAPRGLASIFHIVITWLDVLLIGTLRSAAEAGIYAAVSRLVMFGVFAIEAVRLAIAPQISALLARHDRDAAQMVYRVGTWWLMALSWPLYLAMAVFAPLVLKMFGPEFAAGETPLLILSLAMLIGIGTGNVTVVLLMAGKSVWNLANTIVALVVNVALNLILIPRFGMNGAAVAWAVSIIVGNLVPLAQVMRFLKLNPFGRGFLLVAIGTTACYAGLGILIRSTMGMTAASLLVFVVVATAIYLLFLTRFRQTLHLSALKEALPGMKVQPRRDAV
jgi:O-antigen/teichoic acid export membrane protein